MPVGYFVGAAIVGSCAMCWRMMGHNTQNIAKEVAVAVACAAGAVNEVGNRINNIKDLHNAKQHVVQQQPAPTQQITSPGQQQAPGRRAGFVIWVSKSGKKVSVM